ncbi:hypothetical protein BpHYR1_046136 [Brachionus plicatilis]|uniref:Uncharacterized protein n=1 Tax=Brachionus plicatilis TaxID=10195 RepID=A0A3M7QKV3_BRAPC|nr:hypothetical protein BpHYR1_046136 [Brachionus plicatilis]
MIYVIILDKYSLDGQKNTLTGLVSKIIDLKAYKTFFFKVVCVLSKKNSYLSLFIYFFVCDERKLLRIKKSKCQVNISKNYVGSRNKEEILGFKKINKK